MLILFNFARLTELKMLCCIFNYPSLYRTSIFRKMDEEFDVQFCFGRNLPGAQNAGIARMDYSVLKRRPKHFRALSFWGKFPWYCGILHLALNRKYDTFLLTGEFNWAYFPFLLLCRMTGKKVYAWGHGLRKPGSYPKLRRFFFDSLAGFFIYGEKGKERMVSLGYPAGKIHVIYNSLCTRDEVPALRKDLKSDIYINHFGNADPVLFFSGRLTAVKRIDMLITAVHKLNTEGCHCNVVLVGDGAERQKLETMVSRAGIGDRIWFFGKCYEENRLSEMIYNADLCVSPGNAGLVAVHALMYGTPIVTHSDFELQMPEYEVIIPGKTGMLFDRGSNDSLMDAIRSWLAAGYDREEVRRNCAEMIEGKWNSDYQIEVFRRYLGGKCAGEDAR